MTAGIDWDSEHRSPGQTDWICDHDPSAVYAVLHLPDILERARCRVLEVGIGLVGLSIRRLAQRHDVVAVDYVEAALAKVRGIAEVHLISEVPGIAPVDIALCHIVLQHCDELGAREILRNVTSVLQPAGRFHCQYAAPLEGMSCTIAEPFIFLRTPETMREWIAAEGGTIVEEWDGGLFPHYGLRWYVAKIARAG